MVWCFVSKLCHHFYLSNRREQEVCAHLEHKGEVFGGNAAGVQQLLVARQRGWVWPRVRVAHSILIAVTALSVYHLRLAHKALQKTTP